MNSARNLLEHEYQAPTPEQIEEAIDLANLFVGLTKMHLEQWDYECCIGNVHEQLDCDTFTNEILVRFEENQKTYLLTGYRGISPDVDSYKLPSLSRAHKVGEVRVTSGQPAFKNIVRLILAARNQRKMRKVMDDWFSRLGV